MSHRYLQQLITHLIFTIIMILQFFLINLKLIILCRLRVIFHYFITLRNLIIFIDFRTLHD